MAGPRARTSYWLRRAVAFRQLAPRARRGQFFLLQGVAEAVAFDCEAMVTLAESFSLLISVAVHQGADEAQAAISVSGYAADLADFFEAWDGVCADAD